MGWNYFEMRGKFCIRSAEPDGAAPLLRGLHSSAILAVVAAAEGLVRVGQVEA